MAANSINNQDWDTVVFNKSKKTTPLKQVDPITKKMSKLDSSDEVQKIIKVSASDRKIITDLRIIKKISQKDLANKLQIKVDIINSIENGTYPENKQLINKIKTLLTKLPIAKTD